jgi:hypothetical protein
VGETPRLGDYLARGLAGWGAAQQTSGLDRLGGLAGGQGAVYDPFGGFQRRQQYAGALRSQEQEAEARRQAQQVRAQGTLAAGDWSGPATADDNATLDGAKIDQFIRSKNAASPLIGKGAYILQVANARGVSAPELLALFWKESSLGSTAGPTFNIAGVGGAGNFAGYGSWEQAIDGAAANLASDLYRGKSVQDHVGYWYAGPERYKKYGLAATDAGDGSAPSPNGTVGDYLNNYVGPTFAGLGVPYSQDAAGTRRGDRLARRHHRRPGRDHAGVRLDRLRRGQPRRLLLRHRDGPARRPAQRRRHRADQGDAALQPGGGRGHHRGQQRLLQGRRRRAGRAQNPP